MAEDHPILIHPSPLGEKSLALTLTPMLKLSPWNNGSTLYDSYEFRAINQQLKKTLQAAQASAGPFRPYGRHLGQLCKESAISPKRLPAPRVVALKQTATPKVSDKRGRMFIQGLWKKLKKSILQK